VICISEITAISLAYGGTTVNLKVTMLNKPKPRVIARGQIALGNEIIQHIGWRNRNIIISCDLSGTDMFTDLTNLEAFRDGAFKVSYTDSEIGPIDVLVSEINCPRIGGTEPSFLRCVISCVAV